MPNEFGGPSATSSLLTGVGTSLMDALAQNFKDERSKEEKDKQFDYEMLMRAMSTMKEDLTPSQVSEILMRGVDIFKPKGHGGVKENIKQIFGGYPQHQPEAGRIMGDVTNKPRLSVQMPTQTATPGGTGEDQVRARTVTVPPPPQSRPELTYRELDMEEEAQKQGLMLERQQALQDDRFRQQEQLTKVRTDEAIRRVKAVLPMQEQWRAERKLAEKAYIVAQQTGKSPTDPTVLKQAADELEYEYKMRVENHKAKLAYYEERNKKMKADIQAANERIAIARQHLSQTKQNADRKLPQIQQADSEINKLMNEAQRMRVLAGQAWGNYSATGDEQWKRQAEASDAEAEQYETEAKGKVVFKENYLKWHDEQKPGAGTGGGVKLPNAPGSGRQGTKLTVAEATAGLRRRHPDWSDAQVTAAVEEERKKPNSRIAQ